MPPAVLNDSEDEEDAVLYDDPKNDSLSRSIGEASAGDPALDGMRATNHQSTGSTERLKGQINDAHWNLCEDSSEHPRLNGKPGQETTDSPSLQRDKRRHSFARESSTPALDPVKRAKTTTTTTYSTKKPTSSSLQREQFLAEFGQDAIAPNTSPSIRFSDHSGAKGFSCLPAGSIQAEFINHEPAMFKDSGSTVPDNESSHERMLEQALRSRSHKVPASPGIKLVEPDELARSSSFPWSASEQTGSTESNRIQKLPVSTAEHNGQEQPNERQSHDTIEGQHPQQAEKYTSATPAFDEHAVPGPATAIMVPQGDQPAVQRSSPTVHIDVSAEQATVLPELVATLEEQPHKPGRGRKRKVQEESSEPLKSDDIAVGLPKERYKPRPSRRRATQIEEEPIDYSMIPEKAAKIKRVKTMGSKANAPDDITPAANKPASPSVQREPKPAKAQDVTEATNTAAKALRDDEVANGTPDDLSKPTPVVEVPAPVVAQLPQTKQEDPEIKAISASQASNKSSNQDDDLFVKPAPKPKPTSRSKRSSTTIFEDHVDFTRKSKSPSLSQQQAIRKSALRDVKNEASPAKARRSGKPIIHDDDEDELAMDPVSQDETRHESPDEPPKKRGRGRPPKAASKANAKTTAKTPKKLDVEPDGDGDDDGDEIAIEQQPKKRRGRPPKSAVSVPNADVSKELSGVDEDQPKTVDEGMEVTPAKSIEKATEQAMPTEQNSVKAIPTPSPDKQPSSDSSAGPGKQAKPSPVTHSPLKSKSPAPYRVGLSKKHRIPSLLRVMRPPPPKRG